MCCAMGLAPPLMGGCAASSGSAVGDPLPACPDKPNCVSSLDPRPDHTVAPLSFRGEWMGARERLVSLLATMARTKVTAVEDRFIRAECRSRIFRFVDDLTFYFDPDRGLIQVRSASRVGSSDMGVNRKRVEAIRKLWAQESAAK
ncbi:MAG: DUF1499 domain-containing protein [Desulfobacterales bacterium]|nr:DUF1499 domain-containing protein [Desulfobacterales bacterium]